jgi:hypothetical protein
MLAQGLQLGIQAEPGAIEPPVFTRASQAAGPALPVAETNLRAGQREPELG